MSTTATRTTSGPAGRRDRRAAATRPRTARPAAGTGPARGTSLLRTPPRPLPPHHLFAERLLAVLSGERPVHWMLGQTVGKAYDQLIRLAPTTPLRGRGTRPVVRRCGGHRLGTDVVEAFASIAAGEQVRAMAFRLERGPDHRWRCAAVELGTAHG
ncbi:Rv3235 family protein [Streptomyces sp. NPDC046887]|uniref:Rv3235 family protein n=1 Tax=Streptomyces sp. NPDC046887 TaxID=3155472 RepID=UPI0033EFCB0D